MTPNPPPNTPDPTLLLSQLLDKGYTDTTGAVIAAIARDTERGPLADRLKQFDERAKELADQGETMKPDDPTLRALLADFGDALKKDQVLIDAVSPGLEEGGINAAGEFVRQTALPGFSDEQLLRIGIQWNKPDPEAINQVVQFTTSDAWKAELAGYGDIEGMVAQIALRGIVGGLGPLQIAAEVRAAMESIPAYRANSLMRTLQLESYRAAVAENQLANSDILLEQVRIAALDDRTCLACIALHGTVMELGEVVEDHDNGRCTSITRLKGQTGDIIFQRYIDDHPFLFKTGEEWFNALPPERQQAIAGAANWNAMQAGEVNLGDFVAHYESPIFGSMINQASLSSILGDKAPDFYKRNQPTE